MSGFFKHASPGILIGPVLYGPVTDLGGRMQSLEFLSLTGVTAGSAGLGSPIIASGANMMFERETFLEFLEEADPPACSGEDVFFVIWGKRRSHATVTYLLSREAAVYTEPVKRFRDFTAQRIRWASKSRYYRDPFLIISALIVYLFNLALLLLLTGGIFIPVLLKGFFLMFAAKCTIDLIFLTDVCTKFRQGNLLRAFLPVQVLYPFYIVITGTSGLMFPYIWKGRRKGRTWSHG
jgi:cellulose synthase/poly-beta-1,6-N-acetylglucosamine synthase-like glycosyltransferase